MSSQPLDAGYRRTSTHCRPIGSSHLTGADGALVDGRTNLLVLKPSRKRLVPGDIFALKPEGHPVYFGRVISTDARVGPFPGILIYIHNASSNVADDVPELRRESLLVPPLITNRLPWTKGYFLHV